MTGVKNLYVRDKQRGVGALLEKAKKSDTGATFTMPSVIGEEPLEFELRVVGQGDIENECYLSLYNTRSYKNLTKAAVSDILPSIQLQKRNAIPAVGAYCNDKIEVLAGGRRMYSVCETPGAQFYILVAKNVSDADKKFLANTSDTYNQPSILDVGYKVLEIQNSKKREDGENYTYRDIADMLDISVGRAQEAATFAKYPDHLVSGFPGLRFISYKWLRKMKAYSDSFEQKKAEIIETYSGDIEISDMQDAEKYSASLQKKIETVLKPLVESSSEIIRWKNKVVPSGVKVSSSGKDLTLKLSLDKVDAELLKKLEKLLS